MTKKTNLDAAIVTELHDIIAAAADQTAHGATLVQQGRDASTGWRLVAFPKLAKAGETLRKKAGQTKLSADLATEYVAEAFKGTKWQKGDSKRTNEAVIKRAVRCAGKYPEIKKACDAAWKDLSKEIQGKLRFPHIVEGAMTSYVRDDVMPSKTSVSKAAKQSFDDKHGDGAWTSDKFYAGLKRYADKWRDHGVTDAALDKIVNAKAEAPKAEAPKAEAPKEEAPQETAPQPSTDDILKGMLTLFAQMSQK